MKRAAAYLIVAVTILVTGCGLGRAVAPDPPPLPATNYYEVETSLGSFVIQLSDDTPIHRDNFKRLVAEGFYDGTTFHRVIRGFMIQGGAPSSRLAHSERLGSGGPGYTLPAEIVPGTTHAVGAVAAARQADTANPERRSSGSQFYIVTGDRARHLDGAYTVFGLVVEGLDTLGRIERVPTYRRLPGQRPSPDFIRDQPLQDVSMQIRPLPNYSAPEG